jgi:hypothetical protein
LRYGDKGEDTDNNYDDNQLNKGKGFLSVAHFNVF